MIFLLSLASCTQSIIWLGTLTSQSQNNSGNMYDCDNDSVYYQSSTIKFY